MKQGQLQEQKVRQLGSKTGSPHLFPHESGDKGRGHYHKSAKKHTKKK